MDHLNHIHLYPLETRKDRFEIESQVCHTKRLVGSLIRQEKRADRNDALRGLLIPAPVRITIRWDWRIS